MTVNLGALRGVFLALALSLAHALAAAPGAAQADAQRLIQQMTGQELSPDQILERLRSSGVTREQAKSRLAAAGYDPALVDPYYDRLEGRGGVLPGSTEGMAPALAALGLLQEGVVAPGGVSSSSALGRDMVRGDAVYRLGPGDHLLVEVLEGAAAPGSAKTYLLEVSDLGLVQLPQWGQESVVELTLEEVRALLTQRLALVHPGLRATPEPSARLAVTLTRPRSQVRVFGLDAFTRDTDQFEPNLMGPVDPDYRLGPGDQIVLILTGDVELAYSLDVTREGFVVIPDVGQLSVNGLTMERLRERLYARLGQVYSGVRPTPDATTHFDVSLGRLRTNQVFVIGDVARPGAYQVSSVGTVLTALYRAGGPTKNGSFRAVSVQRGGRVVANLDLYDYLLRGDPTRDVRLEQGDVVFVPPVGPQVTLQGQVRRPAIYELKPGEALHDALSFSGGLRAEAFVQRVQVDRILPPQAREPGRDRVLLDADVRAIETGQGAPFVLEPGDRVTVFGVLDRVRGRVTLSGAVWRPGEFEFSPGMTLADLLARGDGLLPSAYDPVAHVRRLIPATGGTRLLRVAIGSGEPAAFPLEDLDEVTVFDVDSLRVAEEVEILGEVKEPGRYPLSRGTTVEDLILAAGGFTAPADPGSISLARIRRGATRTDTLTTVYRTRLGTVPPLALDAEAYAVALPSAVQADEWSLQDGDQVIVRRLAGWAAPAHAVVEGEVLYPGPYALQTRDERLSNLLTRAGGITTEAYVPGARLERDSLPVSIDLAGALERPGGAADIALEAGDILTIPPFDPTVAVSGEVLFPIRVLHRSGMGVQDYLAEAGGLESRGDLDRVSVRYPDGRRAVAKKFLFFRSFPSVEPGSEVHVPTKAENGGGTDWDGFITRTLGIATSVLTILVLSNQLK